MPGNPTEALLKKVLNEVTMLKLRVEQGTPLLLGVEAAAKMLSMSPQTLRNRIGPKSKHPFPVKTVRIDSRPKFRLKDLEDYVNKL